MSEACLVSVTPVPVAELVGGGQGACQQDDAGEWNNDADDLAGGVIFPRAGGGRRGCGWERR